MSTAFLSVDPLNPQPDVIARAAEVLRRGGLVAFPTETVYGLGASALDAAAVHGIFTAKGRPATNPIIVHVADVEGVAEIATAWPSIAAKLAAHFWPGPLTLVLPKRAVVPAIVTAGGPTIAVRMPAHPVALALIRAAGVPLAAPSANRSTELSPTRATHVLDCLDGLIDMILDGGPAPRGIESTVLDVTGSPPRLLRPGLVTPTDIERIIGPIQRGMELTADQVIPSPGMLARHYAPGTPLELSERGSEHVASLLATGLSVGWLTTEEGGSLARVARIVMPQDPRDYAAALYAALHMLDAVDLDRIVVDLPPEGDEWLAVRDRLRRAATPPLAP